MPSRNTGNLLRLAEMPRAGLEIASLLASSPWLGLSPRGQRHPVVVIPGFLADDGSTSVLRQYLDFLGYNVYAWEQGRNMGAARMGGYAPLIRHVLQIHEQTKQKVSLVGWSLGGVHALAVASHVGHAVRQLLAMGSPISGTPHDISPELPFTTIYSRTDGVVPWRHSHIPAGARRDNIEVHSSHIGLGFNPSVLYALADRLAQREGQFSAFSRHGWRALTYPVPQVK